MVAGEVVPDVPTGLIMETFNGANGGAAEQAAAASAVDAKASANAHLEDRAPPGAARQAELFEAKNKIPRD